LGAGIDPEEQGARGHGWREEVGRGTGGLSMGREGGGGLQGTPRRGTRPTGG
jgi:hypothetical protein